MQTVQNIRKKAIRLSVWAILSALISVALGITWRLWLVGHYQTKILSPERVPPARVAIVYGALVYPDGRLSPMLADRVERAIELYHAGKVAKILMSGDNRFDHYNEPDNMIRYALTRGVDAADLYADYAGQRTYDTCYRAKAIFQLDEAILVTQQFHLPRAIFTCEQLGLHVNGVAADQRRYHRASVTYSTIRETLSSAYALVDVVHRQPANIMGAPINIE